MALGWGKGWKDRDFVVSDYSSNYGPPPCREFGQKSPETPAFCSPATLSTMGGWE
jgi:hypothetical protein